MIALLLLIYLYLNAIVLGRYTSRSYYVDEVYIMNLVLIVLFGCFIYSAAIIKDG